MNYQLAKKLKDSGFPQDIKSFDTVITDSETNKMVKVPTLSELIYECGYGFGGINKNINGFRSWGGKVSTLGISEFRVDGETPEEAVANLWLELNRVDK